MAPDADRSPRMVGRYALHGEIASGGMATVHFGRLLGPAGFSRTVAVKRLHAHLAKDPEFVSMFLDEARLAARIRHPNVVPTLDVVSTEGELFLVMEYVPGESLSRLVRAAHDDGTTIPFPIAAAIVAGALHGLHAAHEATNERGEPLDLVHRDVSPQNVLVGVDGAVRVLDFGIAKAVGRVSTTRDGRLKGKLAYMAPEQLRHGIVDRRTDIYAAGVVLWELLADARLFESESEGGLITKILETRIEAPGKRRRDVPRELDELTMRALAKNPGDRFGTARQMARAIESAIACASPSQVGEWLERIAFDSLEGRARVVSAIESGEMTASESTTAPIVAAAPAAEADTTIEAMPSHAEPRSSRKSWVALAFVAGLAVAGLAVLGVRALGRNDVSDRSTSGASGTTTHAATTSASPTIDTTTSASASTTTSASASVTTTILASVAPRPSMPPPKTVHATTIHATTIPKATATATATAPCTVKSYVDAAGVKHYVNDCSKKP